MLWSFASAETPAKSNGSKVFEVQVAKNGTVYRMFTVFLCSARQKPLQIATFLSWPRPKTPLLTVFLNTLSKNTAIRDVLANVVAENTVKPRQRTKPL